MFRVSIKSLFVAISIVAVAFVLLDGVSVKNPVAATIIFAMLLLSLLSGLIAYDKMYCRAFGIGAVPPLLFFLACSVFPTSFTVMTNDSIAILMILIPACGCITMFARKLLVPKEFDEDLESPRTNLLKELVTGLILGLIIGGLTCYVVEASGILKPKDYYRDIIPATQVDELPTL